MRYEKPEMEVMEFKENVYMSMSVEDNYNSSGDGSFGGGIQNGN